MRLSEREMLISLGRGDSIASVCDAAGVSREEFDQWWRECTERRVPASDGVLKCSIGGKAEICRDEWGIPHIHADNDDDLFFAFGVAMAHDRLFQLDYLRRKGSGRLSEVLGESGLAQDALVRTVGLRRIAEDEWTRLPDETQAVLNAFTRGINAVIESLDDNVPIEFDLLDYRPEAWTPIDCLTIESEMRWYLTGRFPVLVIPELAKRQLGSGSALEHDFLHGEADDECILPPGSYTPNADASANEPVGHVMGAPDDGIGSNNWVVAGKHTASGAPLVASDPHIAIEAVSCWYQVHLCGGSYDVVGMSYVGMPAVMFGRNQHVAWAITNNICSQRDLYQEQTDDAHPGCFRFGDEWEPARQITETIKVKDSADVQKTICFSRNGPIVDEILPEAARDTGPVSLKWLGAYHGGWLTSLLAMDRSRDVNEFKEALRPWHVPTFSLMFADNDGHIGYKASGRIPLRKRVERGYRRGWDPDDQWQGLIPFEANPESIDPERGWISSANNRICPDDYPYPLSGTWARGHRQQRIREMFEERINADQKITRIDFRAMQQDTVSVRAIDCLPALCDLLKQSDDERIAAAVDLLQSWDQRVEADAVGATIFNVFFTFWARRVTSQRFSSRTTEFVAAGAEPCASRLLSGNPHGWFAGEDREQQILTTFENTLDFLADRFGSNMSEWTWGKLHILTMPHCLSSRGELGQLLNQGGIGVKGDMGTVCNTGSGVDWTAATGAGYRMVAELTDRSRGLFANDAPSQSGHPGSPHYRDQLGTWLAGNYHFLPLGKDESKTNILRVARLDS